MPTAPIVPPTHTSRRTVAWPYPVAAALVGLAGLGAFVVSGCDGGGSAVAKPEALEAPLPVQRFERIVEDLRESLGVDNQAPRRVPGGPGAPSTEWSYELHDKLVEPATSSENYRGVITITTKSTVTVYSRADEVDEGGSESESAKSSFGPSDEELAETGEQPAADSGAGGASPLRSASPIKRHESDEVEKFELEYIDNRWRVLNPPDKDSALETIFEHAIDLQ